MRYHLDALVENQSGVLRSSSNCKIVFAGDYATATDLKTDFLAQYPNYVSEINKNLARSRKVGPFRIDNKKSLIEILSDTKGIQKKISRSGKSEAMRYVQAELEKMELGHCGDRQPKSLSNWQRVRGSHLYEMFDGKKEFLFCDSTGEEAGDSQTRIESKGVYYIISRYMLCCDKFNHGSYGFVWITDLTVNEMLTLLDDDVDEGDFGYIFFGLEGDTVVKLDKSKLISDFAKTPAGAKAAYKTAQKYDRYFRTALPQYSGKDVLKEAFSLYKNAAKMGHPGAQFQLGELYNFGCDACPQDREKALHWYLMAEYGKNHLKGVGENVLEEVHSYAPGKIMGLVLEVPSGREMLRKYVGDEEAEALIKEAEAEARIDKLIDMMDQETMTHVANTLLQFLDHT